MSSDGKKPVKGDSKAEKLLTVAIAATVGWLIFLVFWVGTIKPSNTKLFFSLPPTEPEFAFFKSLRSLSLNEFGDFLAGGFAPLAFGWVTIAVVLQWSELRRQRVEHEETRRILGEQQKVLDAQLNQNALSQMDDLFLSQAKDLGRHLETTWNPEKIDILSGLAEYPVKKRTGLSKLEKLQTFLTLCNELLGRLLQPDSDTIIIGAWTNEKSDAFIITKEKTKALMDIQNNCSLKISSSDLMQEILVLNYSLDRVVFSTEDQSPSEC